MIHRCACVCGCRAYTTRKGMCRLCLADVNPLNPRTHTVRIKVRRLPVTRVDRVG